MEKNMISIIKYIAMMLLCIVVAILVTLVIVIFGASFGLNICSFIESLLGAAADSPVWKISRMYLEFIGIWIVTILLFVVFKTMRPMLHAVGTKCPGNNLKYLLVGLGIGFGANGLLAVLAMLNGDIYLSFDSFRPVSLILVFICVFIQSSAEELICRCYMYQKVLKGSGSVLLAILVNSVFFALLHAGNPGVGPVPYMNLFLSGLIFSLMVYYMDSLWAAFGMHAAWNYTQNIILGLPNSGLVTPFSIFKVDAVAAESSLVYDAAFGIEGAVSGVILLSAVAALIIFWGRKNNKKPTDIWALAEKAKAPAEEAVQA